MLSDKPSGTWLMDGLQAFPEPNSRAPFFRRSDNQAINSIQWVLNERKTITLSYVDQQITSLYEFSILLGGLLLGTGVSGFLNWLTDVSAKARRWNPGTRHPERYLAVQGRLDSGLRDGQTPTLSCQTGGAIARRLESNQHPMARNP